jgi:biopolymer transport protein ExbD
MSKRTTRLTTRLSRTDGLLLAPLLDMIFLVLLFFLFNINFDKTKSFDIQIPQSRQLDQDVAAVDLVVIVTNDKYVINGVSVVEGDFMEKLGQLLSDKKEKKILLLGSESISYKKLISVMDIMKEAGAMSISLGIEKI